MRHIFTIALSIIALIVISPSAADAQSPRRVLLELFTNAGAPGNEEKEQTYEGGYLQKLPHLSDVVPISFHTNFPGPDTVNVINAPLHDARTALYSPATVPAVYVNGKLPEPSGGNDGLGDTAALSRAIEQYRGTMSPITLEIDQSFTGGGWRAQVDVSTTEALAGKRLYILLVDFFSYFRGTAAEGRGAFYRTVRAIDTSQQYDLTLEAGEKKSFVAELPMMDLLDTSDVYIVAFVQDTATKEVLQANDNYAVPQIGANQVSVIYSPEVKPIEFTGNYRTSSASLCSFEILSETPDGWEVDVTVDGRTMQGTDTLTMYPGTVYPWRIVITPTTVTPQRNTTVGILIKPMRGRFTVSFYTCYVEPITALLFPRHESELPITSQYDQALSAAGVPFAQVGLRDIGLFDLSKKVLVGVYGKQSLQSQDMAIIRDAMANGSRMLISGAEVAFSLADPASDSTLWPHDPSFLRNQLHADYINDDGGSTTAYGVPGDPVSDGMTVAFGNGVRNQDTPDEIAPVDGVVPMFHYKSDRTRVAGIRYEDERNRLIYLAFGMEGIGNFQHRTNLMRKSIEWLLGPSSVQASRETASASIGSVHPNPTTGAVELPLHLVAAADVRITLHDMRGEQVALQERRFEAGSSTVRFDVSNLPSGVYSVHVRIGDASRTTMMRVVR